MSSEWESGTGSASVSAQPRAAGSAGAGSSAAASVPSLAVLGCPATVSLLHLQPWLLHFCWGGAGKVYGPGTPMITSIATTQTKNYDLEICKKPVT